MILQLTLHHLNHDEKRRWLAILAGSSTESAEIQLGLKYEDGMEVEAKSRGQYPERIRLIKFNSSVKRDSDQVFLYDNCLTLSNRANGLCLKKEGRVKGLPEFFRVTEDRNSICIEFKLTTNVTSKSHENNSFKFCSQASLGSTLDLDCSPAVGSSFVFELVAKHRTERSSGGSGKHRAPSGAAKNVTRTSPALPARAQRSVSEITLLGVETSGRPGDLITCIGSDVSAQGVTAEVELVEEDAPEAEPENPRSRKRRCKSQSLKASLRRDPALSETDRFVSQLPPHLPPGTYHVRMISGSKSLVDSEELLFSVVAAPEPVPRQPGRPPPSMATPAMAPRHAGANRLRATKLAKQNSAPLFRCDSSLALHKQFSNSWPQSKAVPDELLPSAAELEIRPSPQMGRSQILIPSRSELDLSYKKLDPRGAVGQLDKVLAESDWGSQIEMDEMDNQLVKAADVSNITEGMMHSHDMWLSGPNVEHMDTDDSADELPPNPPKCTQQPPTAGLSRQPSFVRVPSVGESLWAQFLDEDSIDVAVAKLPFPDADAPQLMPQSAA